MSLTTYRLLVIEDSDEDFETLNRIITQVSTLSLDIHRCMDGEDGLNWLNQSGKYSASDDNQNHCNPDLIILDLNLPGIDGCKIVGMIRQTKSLKAIPIVVLSTSSNPQDIEGCYQAGVNGYMLKSIDINPLRDSIRIMLDYWFKAIILPSSRKV
jgi:CheY-like chemotaxis protein